MVIWNKPIQEKQPAIRYYYCGYFRCSHAIFRDDIIQKPFNIHFSPFFATCQNNSTRKGVADSVCVVSQI